MTRIAVLFVAALGLAACGNTPLERAVTGGGAGAAAGLGAAALTGGNLGTGALIGAGIGAAAGALTDCTQVGSCTGPLN
jgi:osmotically inducible lipoprotein OsmB